MLLAVLLAQSIYEWKAEFSLSFMNGKQDSLSSPSPVTLSLMVC